MTDCKLSRQLDEYAMENAHIEDEYGDQVRLTTNGWLALRDRAAALELDAERYQALMKQSWLQTAAKLGIPAMTDEWIASFNAIVDAMRQQDGREAL